MAYHQYHNCTIQNRCSLGLTNPIMASRPTCFLPKLLRCGHSWKKLQNNGTCALLLRQLHHVASSALVTSNPHLTGGMWIMLLWSTVHCTQSIHHSTHHHHNRDQFFGNCTDCQVDILATHYYGCDVQGLKWYLDQCRKYGLPIWLTEFDCPNGMGTLDKQREYMLKVIGCCC